MGATGIVGQQFVRLLDEHPYFEVVGLTASDRSAGKMYSSTEWVVGGQIPDMAKGLLVEETRLETILRHDVDLVFSALPGGIAYDIEAALARAGLPVFSNASAHRMDRDVPILCPEVNSQHIDLIQTQDYGEGFIVTNSNCSVSGVVLALSPLMSYDVRDVFVTTYQAVSGAGRHGVASLDILSNVIPYIAKEEEKIENESRKMLGQLGDGMIQPAEFDVCASCARVPTINGHLESVVVRLGRPITAQDAEEIMRQFTSVPQRLHLPTAPERPLIVLSGSDRPQPRRDLSTGPGDTGMSVKVGRVREKCNGELIAFFLLVHNTIRGAAGAAILNAEFAKARGVIP